MGAPGYTGEGRFEYDGAEYLITLNDMALIEAEGVLGESMLDFIPMIVEQIESNVNPQVRHIAALIYGGLKVNHRFIRQKDVVAMVRQRPEGLMEAMMTAMEALDIPEDDAPGNVSAPAVKPGKPRGNGTGTGSTKRGARQGSNRKRSG